MNTNSHHLMIVAGEASGDIHAAHLVNELKKLNPSLTFSGLGGQHLKKADVEIYFDLTEIAVVGFVEVLKHYSEFKKIFHLFVAKVKERRPAAVILVDYPGFNLRLAKELKKLDVKVIYYISPQVWAWKENRVQQIQRDIDKMLVLFQFEKKFYAQRGVSVDFVGHPLVDNAKVTRLGEGFLQASGLLIGRPTVGILPGSRVKEVETLLPIMLKTAALLKSLHHDIQFVLIQSPTIPDELIKKISEECNLHACIVKDDTYNAINACDVCMVASGTATLETAILGKPMVVVYKTIFLTWLIARLLIKIPYIGLVNVVAGKKIVPECIQFDATPERIATEIKALLYNNSLIADTQRELKRVQLSLGNPGASRRAAEVIVQSLTL